MDLHLRGKTAVVTGASKGIGRAIAQGLAVEGVDLVLCARSEGLLSSLADELAATHEVQAHCLAADLATADGVAALAAFAIERLGHVDILVNNAGAIPAGTIETLGDEEWRESYDLKLWSYVRLARALLPDMKRQGGGVIINIIGNAGKRPSAGYIAGGIANAGLMNFTAGLAQDAGPYGVRVVGINPGLTRTERMDQLIDRQARERGVTVEQQAQEMGRGVPLRRVGEPSEVADLAVFLASDRAAYITGCVIPIEGGATAAL
ncbi:MAG TPA: short-chain dehydrogenase/reductase [Dehalococcoidia bacterium]|nr:short-chain dehydrogenase/reductase [Dehalococcoidia bacterium]